MPKAPYNILLALLSPTLLLFISCQKTPDQIKQQLVKEGIEVSSDNLVKAAAHSDTLLLTRLLSTGLDPNQKSQDGRSAFMAAAETNQIHAMKLLVDHGADASQTLPDGRSALHLASAAGHLDGCALSSQPLPVRRPSRQAGPQSPRRCRRAESPRNPETPHRRQHPGTA
ncbi:MAG: ankyrin repeat domain-containing protein [Blastochloris sp.]|nr:ankyrin repeat domain-containing protein [Blastochloris sp.]